MTLSDQDLINKANLVRKQVLEDCYKYQNGHLSSCLSCVDILTVLYFGGFVGEGKGKFILSKGHANLTHNVVLKMMGYDVCEPTSHPECGQVGVETTTGSLGQGLGIAIGMALANKIRGSKEHIYCLVGDGECSEGLTMEGLQFAREYRLPLTIIVDYNMYSAERLILLRPLFIYHGINGHSVKELYNSFKNVRANFVICNTIKGYGIPSIYGSKLIHYITPSDINIEQFREEMERFIKNGI
jgi:transketolase